MNMLENISPPQAGIEPWSLGWISDTLPIELSDHLTLMEAYFV